MEVVLPIRCKPGKKLSPEEREINRLQFRIRVRVENAIRRVKTHRIMGDRYRNPLKSTTAPTISYADLSTRGCFGGRLKQPDENDPENRVEAA